MYLFKSITFGFIRYVCALVLVYLFGRLHRHTRTHIRNRTPFDIVAAIMGVRECVLFFRPLSVLVPSGMMISNVYDFDNVLCI